MRDLEALPRERREGHRTEKSCLMEDYVKQANRIRCVGYARSAVGPVDGQADEILRHCRGFALLDVLREPGRSARDMNRPQLKKLLRMVRRGRVDAVVVVRLTALARSPEHLNHLLREFERHGVRLIAVGDGIDTASAGGKAQVDALRSLARTLRATDARKSRTA